MHFSPAGMALKIAITHLTHHKVVHHATVASKGQANRGDFVPPLSFLHVRSRTLQ